MAEPRGRGALVLGGDYRGLGVVRSLGRRGIPVWVVVDHHRIAAFSRYARRRVTAPLGGPADRLAHLLALHRTHDLAGWALVPTGDEALAFIADHYAALAERFLVTSPPWDVLRWAHDKRLTYRLAAEAGVPCPRTDYPRTPEEVAEMPCAFPALLKPAIRQGASRLVHQKAWIVGDRPALLAGYETARSLLAAELIMVQEMIPGGGEAQFSFAALCRDGEPVVSVAARRTRQYPPTIGRSSSYVESVEQPEVEELGRTILKRMAVTGLVEVEFKRDPRDGAFKLLDINPRVWGWHTLGQAQGLDFAYLHWQLVHGLPVPARRGPPGLRWVRTVTDIPAAALDLYQGRLSPRAYFRSLRGPIESAMFAADDPLPGLLEVPLLFALAVRRGAL
ncbi:MAG: ATP-grasp domain-containing protein [Candidatus Methylomirabilales bacterium]